MITVLALAGMLVFMTAFEASAGEGVCVRCHPLDRFIGQAPHLTWPGPMGWWKMTRCPDLLLIKWQMYLTESRLYRLEKTVRAGREEESPEYAARLGDLAKQYRKLLRQDLVSADDFARRAASIRRDMNNKVFRPLVDRERRTDIIWAVMGLVLVLLAGTILFFLQINLLKRNKLSAFYHLGARSANKADQTGPE